MKKTAPGTALARLKAGVAKLRAAGLQRPLRLLGMAAGAAALTGLLGFLYLKSQGVDYRQRNEILGYLRELKEIDGRWDIEVLRSRIEAAAGRHSGGAVQNERVTELLRRLRTAAAEVHSPALERGLPELARAFEQKTGLLDRYRSAAATVSSALAEMVEFDTEIAELVRGAWQSVPQRERLVAVEATAGLLLAHVVRYAADPGEERRGHVETFAADLRQAGNGMPQGLREGLARMDAKVQQVLGAKPAEDEIFRRIALASAGPRIDSLSDTFSAETVQAQINGERYRIYLIAYAGAMLVLIGWLLSKLAISYRLLESRVEERTRELSQALIRLKESESQLIQTEKMSSLGQMVAGIAHEINTPLAYVKNSLGAVLSKLPQAKKLVFETDRLLGLMQSGSPDPALLRSQYLSVREIVNLFTAQQTLAELGQLAGDGLYGIEQIAEIVLNLKDFSRLDRSKVSSFNLNEGLQSALLIAKHELKHLRVNRQFGDIPAITCSPSQMNQVFLNLINNAAQAIDGAGGEITLRTRIADAGHVAVEITDNGKGIAPQIMPKIFDPFFTTKPAGRGTGLGLSISYKIVERHGGRISVDSTPGKGTTFTLVLPLVPPEPEALQ